MLLEFRGRTYWGREGGQVFEKDDGRRTETGGAADIFATEGVHQCPKQRLTDSLGES